jgi:hypothetical protein
MVVQDEPFADARHEEDDQEETHLAKKAFSFFDRLPKS